MLGTPIHLEKDGDAEVHSDKRGSMGWWEASGQGVRAPKTWLCH